ncbi:MAG: hypothetical protein M3O87_03940 [Candidatus Dormibacteraeota bacterium]|nr:hypothetical protein [Candidatus Dormibacteraeota bacterium]
MTALPFAAACATGSGPGSGPEVPAGKYQCYQYSYPSGYLYFGSVEFKPGGEYAPVNAGGGHYTMTADGKITFSDGNYKDNAWSGEYHKPDGKDYKSETVVLDPGKLKISCHA